MATVNTCRRYSRIIYSDEDPAFKTHLMLFCSSSQFIIAINAVFFFEILNQRKLEKKMGHEVSFVQGNHSYSAKNVLRDLRYQIQQLQGKLMRVVISEVFINPAHKYCFIVGTA